MMPMIFYGRLGRQLGFMQNALKTPIRMGRAVRFRVQLPQIWQRAEAFGKQ